MKKLAPLLCFLVSAFLAAGCGDGESEEDVKRAEASGDCEQVCVFWSACNSRKLENGECAEFCDAQVDEVSGDCFERYAAWTSCDADNLHCNGTACQTEYDAYSACESGGSSSEVSSDAENNDPAAGPGDNF